MVSSSLQGNTESENARKAICVMQSVTSYALQSTGVYSAPLCEVVFPAKKAIQGEICDYFPSKAQILGTRGCNPRDRLVLRTKPLESFLQDDSWFADTGRAVTQT